MSVSTPCTRAQVSRGSWSRARGLGVSDGVATPQVSHGVAWASVSAPPAGPCGRPNVRCATHALQSSPGAAASASRRGRPRRNPGVANGRCRPHHPTTIARDLPPVETHLDRTGGADTVPRATALASVIQRGQVMRDTLFLNNIIDAVADPILVKDSQLRFVLVNQALCEFTGIPRERFIGRTDADLFARRAGGGVQRHGPQVSSPPASPTSTRKCTCMRDGSDAHDPHHQDDLPRRGWQRGAGGHLHRPDGAACDAARTRSGQRAAARAGASGPPDRSAQPHALRRSAGREVAAAERSGESLRRAVHGLERLQAHQRHLRPQHRRRADQPGRRAPGATARRAEFVARLGGDEFVVVARRADDARSAPPGRTSGRRPSNGRSTCRRPRPASRPASASRSFRATAPGATS